MSYTVKHHNYTGELVNELPILIANYYLDVGYEFSDPEAVKEVGSYRHHICSPFNNKLILHNEVTRALGKGHLGTFIHIFILAQYAKDFKLIKAISPTHILIEYKGKIISARTESFDTWQEVTFYLNEGFNSKDFSHAERVEGHWMFKKVVLMELLKYNCEVEGDLDYESIIFKPKKEELKGKSLLETLDFSETFANDVLEGLETRSREGYEGTYYIELLDLYIECRETEEKGKYEVFKLHHRTEHDGFIDLEWVETKIDE